MTDNWWPAAEFELQRRRAGLIAGIRRYFAESGVWEVDTPILDRCTITDPAIEGIAVTIAGPAPSTVYLQTSPEYAMKRLLAAGSGSIFQISKAFRGGELGVRHRPEFSLLEWYRVDFDHHALMGDVEHLLGQLMGAGRCRRHSYVDLFANRTGIDLHQTDDDQLADRAKGLVPGFDTGGVCDRATWIDLLFSHLVSPTLGGDMPEFVFDYPVEQAALAKIGPPPQRSAQRFELFIRGMEIANGYHELTDPVEQRARFDADNRRRARMGQPVHAIDERLLAALAHGLPSCAGVALGLDRLLMVMSGIDRIGKVQAFDIW